MNKDKKEKSVKVKNTAAIQVPGITVGGVYPAVCRADGIFIVYSPTDTVVGNKKWFQIYFEIL